MPTFADTGFIARAMRDLPSLPVAPAQAEWMSRWCRYSDTNGTSTAGLSGGSAVNFLNNRL
jgi:hypothetical protein